MIMLFNFTQHHLQKKPVVLTIGNFDGFHLGHHHILEAMREEVQKLNAATVLVTFNPNPKEFFQTQNFLGRIDSCQQQIERLQKIGFDAVYLLNFDEFIANCCSKEFIHKFLLEQFYLKVIVSGADFKFGKDRQGNIELLRQQGQQYDFVVKTIEPVFNNGVMTSSTQIRLWIWEGDFQSTAKALGRPYSIQGKVEQGLQLARTLDVPTANLSFDFKLPLRYGVYAATVNYQQKMFHAIVNWGTKPTFAKDNPILEAYLFDFEGSLYGETIEVIPQKRIRDEVKFDSAMALKEQIQHDLQQTKLFFQNSHEVLLSGQNYC